MYSNGCGSVDVSSVVSSVVLVVAVQIKIFSISSVNYIKKRGENSITFRRSSRRCRSESRRCGLWRCRGGRRGNFDFYLMIDEIKKKKEKLLRHSN